MQTRDAVELFLYVNREKVEVRLDADGIHFHQPGGSTDGVLPWSSALAMSLLPAGVRPG